MDGLKGIAGWRWLFIIEGSLTIFFGIAFAFIMPEYPHNAKMLSPIERDLAVWRLEQEAGAAEGKEEISNLKAYLSALRDPKVYMLIFCMIMSQAMGTVGNFFPTIIKSFGYNTTITLLITAPPYVFACFVFYIMSYFSDKHQKLYWPLMTCLYRYRHLRDCHVDSQRWRSILCHHVDPSIERHSPAIYLQHPISSCRSTIPQASCGSGTNQCYRWNIKHLG